MLENVAFANFGKFSIKGNGKENIDYANDYCKLENSLEYVKADLEILKPDIIIIPSTIYNHSKIKRIFKNQYPKSKIIPIYQIHHFNINRKDRVKRFEKKDKSLLGVLTEWQKYFGKGLTGITNDNFFSFYTYLDKIIEEMN